MTSRAREALALFPVLAAAALAVAIHDTGSGAWNPVALRTWSEAIRNADVPGGAVWALGHSFPWLPTITLWPFTIFEFTRTALAPYIVSALFTAALGALTWFRIRAQADRISAATVLALVLLNPVTTDIARSGDFRAPTLFLWLLLCTAARDASDVRDARSVLTLAGVAGMAWFCDTKFLILLIPFVPLCALLMPARVLKEAPAAGYLLLLFPSGFALFAAYWAAVVTPGQATPAFSWSLRPADGDTIMLCLAAAVITALPFLQQQRTRLYATLSAIPLVAACLDLAFSTDPRPVFFGALLLGPVILWCESHSAVPRWLPALVLLLWMAPLRSVTVRANGDRELAEWLREHRQATVLADDEALGSALAFADSATNLIVPGTPAYEVQTSGRAPHTDYIIEAGRITVRHVRSGYDLVFDRAPWRVWRRVPETQDLAATY